MFVCVKTKHLRYHQPVYATHLEKHWGMIETCLYEFRKLRLD